VPRRLTRPGRYPIEVRSRGKSLTLVVVSLAVVVLLFTTRHDGQRPHCTVICLGFTNTPTGRFVQFAISNSGPVAIEVGHYGTYSSFQRPKYALPPHVLVNQLYDIPPGQWRVLTTSPLMKPSDAASAVFRWRTEFVYRPAEGILRCQVRKCRIWLNQMWPNDWNAPAEHRLVFNAVSDWIEEPSSEAQTAGPANWIRPIRSETNRTSSADGANR